MANKHAIKVTLVDVNKIAKMFGHEKNEIHETINEMVKKGLFKQVDKNTFDISPFLIFQLRVQDAIRQGKGDIDIKKLHYQITGVHVL